MSYAVEGRTDEPVAERIITSMGHQPTRILTAGGKARLDAKLPGFNRSARHRLWLVMRDLDQDDATICPADLRRRLVDGAVAPGLALRFAVRTVESWLLADVEGFSQFFRVHAGRIPRNPEMLANPKKALVETCRRSRSRAIREGVVPRPGSGRPVGPEYTAAVESPSLARAVSDVERVAGHVA